MGLQTLRTRSRQDPPQRLMADQFRPTDNVNPRPSWALDGEREDGRDHQGRQSFVIGPCQLRGRAWVISPIMARQGECVGNGKGGYYRRAHEGI